MNDINVASKVLFEIDKNIDDLVKKVELLSYVNPLNMEEEKQKFFQSKYLTDPEFTYPTIDFDRFSLHRELFKQPIEQIENESTRALYEDIIYAYSGLIQCIETIGTKHKFYYNSLRSFGTPTEQDVENAKFILHFDEEDDSDAQFQPKYTATETADLFREYSKQYDFTYQIKLSKDMSAIAMVLNNIKTLVINEKHTFSENEIAVLTNHEIGVHMVTTMNGLLHPLKIFSNGFPNYEETQEGLAVFSEYMSNNLTVKRLKELAYRVIAVDSLAKGYSFSKTFRLFVNTYDLDREMAFNISTRAHRGGGFTKDYLYLTGLKKVYDYYRSGKDMKPLLRGKIALDYLGNIESLAKNGCAVDSKHITDSYMQNNNTNKTVDFILENLK
ncbi:flavohemoglobin expression-modulating QEGLA motif protein [Kordia sp.]|uniref:flavohemoglobin expression-modulating QEGLA motif protein n=1 Tax=Kordia sp. TaxID=1965332 RepID=UPI003D6A86D1